MAHTPKGYRIEGESKFMLLSTGQEVDGDATACEMELWQINQELVKALEACSDCWITSSRDMSFHRLMLSARELAEALFPDFTPEIHVEYADIIQAHVSDLLLIAHHALVTHQNGGCIGEKSMHQLKSALEPWEPGE